MARRASFKLSLAITPGRMGRFLVGSYPSGYLGPMATKKDTREATAAARVKSADKAKVTAAVAKIKHRDAELLRRLAR